MCISAETTSHSLELAMAFAVALAFGLDARFGEPRDAWHPVAWLGRLLAPLGRALRTWPAGAACFGGALAWCLLAAALAAAAWAVQSELSGWPVWAAAPLLAVLLKPTFAWRMLRDEVAAQRRRSASTRRARGWPASAAAT